MTLYLCLLSNFKHLLLLFNDFFLYNHCLPSSNENFWNKHSYMTHILSLIISFLFNPNMSIAKVSADTSIWWNPLQEYDMYRADMDACWQANFPEPWQQVDAGQAGQAGQAGALSISAIIWIQQGGLSQMTSTYWCSKRRKWMGCWGLLGSSYLSIQLGMS